MLRRLDWPHWFYLQVKKVISAQVAQNSLQARSVWSQEEKFLPEALGQVIVFFVLLSPAQPLNLEVTP